MVRSQEKLVALTTAYQQERLNDFMKLVSPDFAGDDFMLNRALRRDFQAFDNINLRLSVNTITVDPKGRAQVLLNYTRSVISLRDGKTYTDRGTTSQVAHRSSKSQ